MRYKQKRKLTIDFQYGKQEVSSFVSSTFEDLKEARAKVIEMLLNKNHSIDGVGTCGV